MPPASPTDFYALLEVEHHATSSDIRRAYRRMAKVWHPDRFVGDPELAAYAQERMRGLNAAYEVLRRPATRDSYDAEMAARHEHRHHNQPPRNVAEDADRRRSERRNQEEERRWREHASKWEAEAARWSEQASQWEAARQAEEARWQERVSKWKAAQSQRRAQSFSRAFRSSVVTLAAIAGFALLLTIVTWGWATVNLVSVPDVRGLSPKSARIVIEAEGLRVAGEGDYPHVVMSTSPASGESVVKGTLVTLHIVRP